MGAQSFSEQFSDKDMRMTKQRKWVYEVFSESEVPLSAEKIYRTLINEEKSISLSTIYRILRFFTTKGVITRGATTDHHKAVYELRRTEHKHHLVCVGCEKVVAVNNCPVQSYQESLQKSTRFDITEHRLAFFGYCPDCQGGRESKKNK